jgi:hypothetical protein
LFAGEGVKDTEKTKEEVMAKLNSLNLDPEEKDCDADDDFNNISGQLYCGEC